MTFSQALEEMKAGASVRRRGWKPGLSITRHDAFEVRSEHVFTDDWEIVCYRSPPSVPYLAPTIEELRQAIVATHAALLAHTPFAKYETEEAIAKIRRPYDAR